MKKINFTAERLSSFSCPVGKQQEFLWDARTPGLGVRATARQAKSFIFETRLHGRTLRMTIGDVKTWMIGQAQREATRLKALTDQGIDPRAERAAMRARADAEQAREKREKTSVGEAWSSYIAARRERWGDRHYADHIRLSALGGENSRNAASRARAGVLAPLMHLPLSQLTSDKVASWLQDEAKTRPTSTALAFRLLRAFIRWAADMPQYQGLIPGDSWSASVVRDRVPKSRPKDGDCLQREHLAGWFTYVRKIPNPVISAYLQALLLTGARREEMANLRWDDVDFQWRSITIRDKVDGMRTIPLTPYLSLLLAALPRRNLWVFSSSGSANGRLTEPTYAHNGALRSAGLPHVTLHGLRRSFGTLCEWVEVPSGISAQLMGHKPSALVEKHYRRRPLDLLRKWHDRIEEWILLEAGVERVAGAAADTLRIVSAA